MLEARRVPVSAVPVNTDVPASERERVLPSLRGWSTGRETALNGGNRYGLAPGSALHWWQRRQPSAPR